MDDPALFFEQKAKELKKEKKFEEALLYIDKAKKIHEEEKSPDFWYKKGLHFIEVGEFERAIECFDTDIVKRQKNYEAFFAKGKMLFQLEKFDEALECFNKAAEERHRHFLQASKKVEHLKKIRKFEKALIYTDDASNEKLLDAEFWYYKGISLLRLNKYIDAHSGISNALKLDPENTKFLYDLAKCELFLDRRTECIEVLKKAIKQNPLLKEKLQVDVEFTPLHNNSQFRAMIHL